MGQWGRTSWGRTSWGKTSLGQYPWGRTSWGRRSVGQDVVGQIFVGQDVAGAKSLGQVVMGQKVLGQEVGHHWTVSAEWPALICLYRFEYGDERLYSDGSMKVIGFSDFTTNLYVALSRARIYFKAVLFNHSPNVSEDTDKLLFELRRRKDICRFIEE